MRAFWKSPELRPGKILWNRILITVGSIVCSVAINAVLIPHQFFITTIDPDAFVVVTNTLEVMGLRIGNQPHG